ncbi:uncharacterized protein LOC111692009 [Anoplophora glabripennis]|uniref:uncharacterized protein LOC111692009 n=1 Tax=Anoplophora glabripennis TaxID=217634 RepID=UPI000C767734|nr:uncharacterized protein LOC111692009 [Anoplophora glabripennis]
MEFFGLTAYGVSDPIKDMMRPDYQEPTEPPKDIHSDDSKGNFCERIKELDCYIGFTDGYAYRSWDRLTRMRKKYVFKPVGPYEMYLYPGVNSMCYGWWYSDPLLERNKSSPNWYLPRNTYPMTGSDISKYFS